MIQNAAKEHTPPDDPQQTHLQQAQLAGSIGLVWVVDVGGLKHAGCFLLIFR